MRSQKSRLFTFFHGFLFFFVPGFLIIISCKSIPEEVIHVPKPVEIPTLPSQKEMPPKLPEPFVTEWIGTTWIIRETNKNQNVFPGYKGFHLGPDGMFFPVNLDSSTGGKWSAEDNRITFNLKENANNSYPVKSGTFLSYKPENKNPESITMRLVAEESVNDTGIVFERAFPNVDIIENHWVPKQLEGSENLHWPKEPRVYFLVLPGISREMMLLGFGGENRIRGSVKIRGNTFITGPLALTRRYGPSSDFENLYIKCLTETSNYVQVDDDLFLYRETRPLGAFRVELFD